MSRISTRSQSPFLGLRRFQFSDAGRFHQAHLVSSPMGQRLAGERCETAVIIGTSNSHAAMVVLVAVERLAGEAALSMPSRDGVRSSSALGGKVASFSCREPPCGSRLVRRPVDAADRDDLGFRLRQQRAWVWMLTAPPLYRPALLPSPPWAAAAAGALAGQTRGRAQARSQSTAACCSAAWPWGLALAVDQPATGLACCSPA